MQNSTPTEANPSLIDFLDLLEDSGLSQVRLAAEIKALSGHKMAPSTLSRVVNGVTAPSPYLIAYLRLRQQKGAPEL